MGQRGGRSGEGYVEFIWVVGTAQFKIRWKSYLNFENIYLIAF
jgi:hypothetical protein